MLRRLDFRYSDAKFQYGLNRFIRLGFSGGFVHGNFIDILGFYMLTILQNYWNNNLSMCYAMHRAVCVAKFNEIHSVVLVKKSDMRVHVCK